jgi:predicted XRE-type DNA-binding protein
VQAAHGLTWNSMPERAYDASKVHDAAREETLNTCVLDWELPRQRGSRAMVKNQETDIPVTPGSGNVFADLGFAEPEEELTKAQLASHIRQVIQRRRLTQVAAAALMGIDQPKVSALLNGRLANVSADRLMRLLTALGQDVEIVVRERSSSLDKGRIRVIGEAA